jgi:peptide/nickel transport system ATP-binding protein
MLEVRDLVVRYGFGSDALTAVDGVTLAVPEGGTLGLVGESGSGKSTIGRAVVGLVPVAGGQVLLDGADFTSQRKRTRPEFRRRVQMVFQDPFSSLNPRMSIGEAIGEALARRGVARNARRAEALRALQLVGLGESAMSRYPHQFSGGQRQRIAIARALAMRPDVIVMDEVTSALDVSVQAQILNLLRDLQRELGVSYLFISHDLSVIGVMSDVVAVMYLGQIVERGSPETLFGRPTHPYTQALIRAVPKFATERAPAALRGDLPDPRNPPSGCQFHTRCPVGPLNHPERTICIEVDPHTIATGQPNHAACHFAGVADITREPAPLAF